MLKAKDIMTRDVVTVRKHMGAEEALGLMLGNEIAGIPVVAEDMSLVGIVTEKDLLGLFYEGSGGKKKTVADFMTQPAVHFDENEPLDDICKCLVEVVFRRVPVTSKGKVVGIVSRPDVLKCIMKRMSEEAVCKQGEAEGMSI